jgi:PAS domain S-box-containing protein
LRDRSIGRDIGAGEVLIEGMATDITAGKQIEHELSAKTHMLESVFESAPYIMMLVNAEGRVTDINRIGVQFANRDKEKLLGLLGGEVFGCLNSFYGPGCGKNQICLSCPVRSRFAHTFETGEPIYEGEGQLEIIKDNVKICLDILISTALVETANDRHVLVTIADITARKQAEQALKLRESYLTAIVENHPGLVWLKDSQGRFLTVNQAFATSCGKTSPTDLVGRTDLDIWPPELAEKYRADDANVIQGKTPVVVEELVFAQGQNTWFETFKTPILDDQNDILGTTGYSRDITARKQAEDAIKKSEERYRSLFDNMTEGFALHELIFDEKGAPRDYRFLDVNRAFEQLTGLQRESIVGKGQREVLPAEDEFWFRTYCRVALTGESVYLDNFSPALQRHYEVYSYSPAPNQFAVVFIDVTARKKAETALRESEQRYRAVADSASDAIITADSVGNVVGWNPSAEKMFGYSEAEINGKPLTILLPAQFQGLHLNGMERVQSGGERRIIGTTVEVEGHRKDGSEFPLELSLAEWQVTSGQFYTAILRDITARKRDERQIKTALADKEILLRELYHRTKNNMQVICAMLELQADNVTDELALRVFRETENKIRSMALIHQMLYQSQNLSSIDLKEYLDELATLLLKSYKIHPGRIALTLDMESVPVLIDFATPCGLIVNELMSNALKYAFPGERKGKISLGLAKSAAGFITLRFSDDGVGLPPGFDLRRAETLGLQTVLALGERQLHGQVTFIQENGLTCQIRFQDTLYEARV